jgi:hypothetical protein
MRHTVAVGEHAASWSDKTHQMDGDRDIVDEVQGMSGAVGDLHEHGVDHDMANPKFVLPAMISAAQTLYGRPVDYYREPERVSVSAPEQTNGARLTSNADA